jgi:hypothetical protein
MSTHESNSQQYITIVSGLPRSGTSMMMQMIAAGGIRPLVDNIREADIDNPKGYYEFERVKQVKEDQDWLEEAQGKVVKMVYRLLYDLPSRYRYRVVFMTRDLDEVIASQQAMLERNGKDGGGLDDGRLAAIYRQQLREVLDWLHAQPNFDVLGISYQAVLDNPEPVIRQLDTFLGNQLDTAAMARVPDQSLHRQRREAQVAAGAAAGH